MGRTQVTPTPLKGNKYPLLEAYICLIEELFHSCTNPNRPTVSIGRKYTKTADNSFDHHQYVPEELYRYAMHTKSIIIGGAIKQGGKKFTHMQP